jgi:hypothetical protein
LVAKESPEVVKDPEIATERVQKWSSRKKFKMKPQHIKKAWQRLKNEQWLTAA